MPVYIQTAALDDLSSSSCGQFPRVQRYRCFGITAVSLIFQESCFHFSVVSQISLKSGLSSVCACVCVSHGAKAWIAVVMGTVKQ